MKIDRKEIKQSAKTHFSNNYAMLLLINLIHNAILSAASSLFVVLAFLIIGPFTYGLNRVHSHAKEEDKVAVKDLFSGFPRYGRHLGAELLVDVFIFLWSLLLIVPGIIKSLSYSLTFYILHADDKVGPKEAMKLSKEMTKGYKGQIFLFRLSFIGWILLSIITFGVFGFFYLDRYFEQSLFELNEKIYNNYYEKKPKETVVAEEKKETKKVKEVKE